MGPSLHMHRAARIACVAGLASAIALGGPLAAAGTAWAESAQTASELDRLTAEVQSAADAYGDATARASELQAQIDELATEILTLEQETIPAQQERAGEAVTNLYKMQSNGGNAISMLLNASSFTDLLNLSRYLGIIEENNTSALEELESAKAELQKKMKSLSSSKDEAVESLESAEESLAQARVAQGKIQARAASEDAAEAEAAARAAEAATQAIQGAQAQAQGQTGSGAASEQAPAADDSGNSGASEQPATPSAPSNPDNGSSSGTSTGGWLSGVASYYGIGDGFMGGTTASGDIVTETSMGIAMLDVPLGTKVEISYKGVSVIAVVNDRGPYADDRVLDMQPAVARALGFVNVGVDTVSYRIL